MANSTSAACPSLDSLFSLHGRVALVTGASRGLGRAMAFALAGAGAHVLVNSRDPQQTALVAAEIVAAGFSAESLAFDVADDDARTGAMAGIARRCGRLDVLINNVGVRLRENLDNIGAQAFAGLLDVDLVAPYALTRLAAPLMQQNGYGRIIMLSSMAARLARAGDAAYITAKGGIEALTRAFACEYGGVGLTCNAIAPGPFATETNAALVANPQTNEIVTRRSPVRRWADPSEIGGTAVFLASASSAYMNGQVLTLDGGMGIAV